MFGCQAAVKHMLLDSESPKYLGDDEGVLNVELMRKLYHVIAYNLAKSRAAKDGNKYKRENYFPKPRILEPGANVLVRDRDSKVFQPQYLDYCVVAMKGKNQVLIKDNHGHETKVHRRDLKLIDSDVKIAELYAELRAIGTRDAQHCMPVKQIPDLGWKTPEDPKAKITPENKAAEPSGRVLRSSKRSIAVAEVKEERNERTKETGTSQFLAIAATTTAVVLCTAACKLIEINLF